jgi:hypothetical protein
MFVFVDDQGKEAENELNNIGPGEATFIFADVTKEEDIQVMDTVCCIYKHINMREYHIIHLEANYSMGKVFFYDVMIVGS